LKSHGAWTFHGHLQSSNSIRACEVAFYMRPVTYVFGLGFDMASAFSSYPSPVNSEWTNAVVWIGVNASPVFKARTLDERGFDVQCIRRSVEERLFKGQKGAARVKTDRGVFEVWFLPKGETFADLEIAERRENGRYFYSIRGTPQISRTIDSSKQSYFVSYKNLLFHVWGDEQLAASIRRAFQKP
jgi:hypothetical protein